MKWTFHETHPAPRDLNHLHVCGGRACREFISDVFVTKTALYSVGPAFFVKTIVRCVQLFAAALCLSLGLVRGTVFNSSYIFFGAWVFCFLPGSPALAAAATSEPVGVSTVSLLAASDTMVSVPFLRAAVSSGQVSSVAGNVISVAGAPAWTPGQFVYVAATQPTTYYAFFGSGVLEGRSFTVTGNGADTLTVDLDGGTLTGVAAGDAVRIVPYWTLGTLFPASAAGSSFTPTIDVSSLQTTVALFVPANTGINGAAASTFFFFSGAWRQTGQSVSVSRNDQVVPPGSPIKIRNAANSGVLVAAGAVAMQKLALPLATQMGVQQDNVLALSRPVPVSLNDSGLVASGAFAASPNALARTDLLMVTDNTVPGLNKAASIFYIYYNSGWRKLGQPLSADFGSDVVFDSSKSVSIRKGPSLDGAKRYWINAATY